ncbi:MAG TPA: dienelactone hydrolase family protein [bacterium]|nr:dienelactone hydrolase family protein [bacterium]
MAIRTERVSITVGEQAFPGYLALPSGTPRGGIVVIQEIFGVNSHIRSVTERAAEAGFAALAPDMFWRVRPGIELGYTPDDIAKGREVRGKITEDSAVQDVSAAMGHLAARREMQGHKLAVMGFCWGGLITYLSACRLKPACVSSYYGGGIANFIKEASKITCPILFHFGELDKSIPMDQVNQVKEAMKSHKDATIYTYPTAEHGFHCDQRGSYNPEAAKVAWQRSIEFFGKHLG